jgi:hypothetical protein
MTATLMSGRYSRSRKLRVNHKRKALCLDDVYRELRYPDTLRRWTGAVRVTSAT